MTYGDLQHVMAVRGFTETPISEKQFDYAMKDLQNFDDVVGVAMDVMCGFSFGLALELNQS